jgi:hypothetical protein
VVAPGGQLRQELGVFGVALDEPVPGMGVEAAANGAVLAEVVDPDNLVAGLQQL